MAADLIRYDLLVQDALREAVRKVLSDVARDGIPGEHHFYIGFRTHARGVRLSSRMRERYPDEMTIVLQHQFWDLSVGEQAFEVGLSFQNVPEMLLVPFDAVTRFADPSVGFELQFLVEDEAPGVSETGSSPPRTAPSSVLEPLADAPTFPEPGTPKKSKKASEPTKAEATPQKGEPKVISIDAFRKKS
ncbi:MAG: SspB family protein [Methylocella sp.]